MKKSNPSPSASHPALQMPRSIALIGKYKSRDITASLVQLAAYLSDRGVTIFIEEETAAHIDSPESARFLVCGFDEIGTHAELAIVLGGDGTMLNAARRLARHAVPLVGINQGRLGFMTDIARDEMLSAMDDLLAGRFLPEKRLLLAVRVLREEREIYSQIALNDFVIDKGSISRLIEFELFINREFIYQQSGDGLIISTPTGSTAYSLSAGGAILHPGLTGISLVPLCPHALTNRPLIVNDEADIEVQIIHAEDVRLHSDGQVTTHLQVGDRVRISCAENSILFLHPPKYSYFAMLRQKLHWSERPRGY